MPDFDVNVGRMDSPMLSSNPWVAISALDIKTFLIIKSFDTIAVQVSLKLFFAIPFA